MGIFCPRAIQLLAVRTRPRSRKLADRVHGVDSRDTGGDHLLGVNAGVRVDGRPVDIQIILGKYLGALVDRSSGAIKDTAQHVLRDTNLEVLSGKLDCRLPDIDTGGTLENLIKLSKQASCGWRRLLTWTTALCPRTSRTWPARLVPSGRVRFTICRSRPQHLNGNPEAERDMRTSLKRGYLTLSRR